LIEDNLSAAYVYAATALMKQEDEKK
jgi:hypothetical protein